MLNEQKDMKTLIDKGYKLQTLMHKINIKSLKEQHEKQQNNKASGVDKITKLKYNENLEENLENLIERMKKFAYTPNPVRRTYIPKVNGKLRPLGIPSYEDKLVQGCMADILSDIYENIFLDCSYGFRPNRSCHMAIKEINQTIMTRKVNYIFEADIKGFFDNVNHDKLMKMLSNTIEDKNFLRYIKKFLISGYMEDGKKYETIKGTPQGGLISPILANVYLHYVLDKWFYRDIQPKLKGEAYLVRYADDFIIMVQYDNEAKLVSKLVEERFKLCNLELEANKTKTIPFGRFKGTKETFDFLGFTFVNGKTRTNKYKVHVKTSKKKLKSKKKDVKLWLNQNMHESIVEVGKTIKLRIIGHYNYYGVNGNYLSLLNYYKYIKYSWYKVLRRRGQKRPIKYEDFDRIWKYLEIPTPTIKVNLWGL